MDSKAAGRRKKDGHERAADKLVSDGGAAGQSAAQLRRVLGVMFPPSYIKLYHQPPRSVCSLFSTKQSFGVPTATSIGAAKFGSPRQTPWPDELESLEGHSQWPAPRLEASTEPSSRAQILNLQRQLAESLKFHQAKPVGLCPVRRAIYDQCFDEIIRQVAVGCIEQGLLLFQIRNELRMTVNCYRRLYESAVTYGLNKAFDSELARHRDELGDHLQPVSRDTSDEAREPGANKSADHKRDEESLTRLKDYYEDELAKREKIIGQQRAVMRALNLSPDQC